MAKAYGMTGGQSGGLPYSGIYNVTPTTSNIALSTNERYLDANLTIDGDSDLIPQNIASGKSLFGVSGTMNAVTFTNNTASAYLSSEGYTTQHQVNSVSEVFSYQTIVPDTNNILDSSVGSQQESVYYNDETNTYICIYYETFGDLSSLYVSLVDTTNGNVIKKIPLFSDSTITQASYKWISNYQDRFALVLDVIRNNESYSTLYLQIYDTSLNLIKSITIASNQAYSTSKMNGSTQIDITYGGSAYTNLASYSWAGDKLGEIASVNTYSSTAIYGDANYITIYYPSLPYSSSQFSGNTASVYSRDGSLILEKLVTQSDFSFVGGSKTSSDEVPLLFAYYFSSDKFIFIYSDSTSSNIGTTTNICIKNSSFTTTTEKRILTIGGINEGYQHIQPTRAVLSTKDLFNSLFFINMLGVARIKLEDCSVVYSLTKSISTSLIYGYYPWYIYSNSAKCICIGSETGTSNSYYVDNSIVTTRTIETDTFTATIEEV